MGFKLFVAVVLTVLNTVSHAQSITRVSQFKLSQGTDPTKMTITWSSPWTTTIPSGQTGTPTTPASQCKYATDQTSLAYSTASTTQQVPLYAEGTVDSYQFQSYSAGVGIGSTKAATGALFPIYSSPVLHYVKLTNLIPGTRYYYVCGDFSGTSGTDFQNTPSTFKTLPAVGSSVDSEGNYLIFGVYMDSGVQSFQSPSTGVFDQTTLTSNNNQYIGSDHRNTIAAVVANTDAPVSMVLHAGDMSYADCNQPMWDTYDFLIEPMTKSIPFHASPGNHEQEISYAQDGKTIFTALEKRYRFGSIPAVFTAASSSGVVNTGIASTAGGFGTVTSTSALSSTSDKNFASANAVPLTSFPALTTAGALTVSQQITDPFQSGTSNPVANNARTGSVTDNLYKCQNSNGGVGKGWFRGNYDYGNSYHSYNAGLAHVVFLNPYVAYEIGSNQYKWFAADLAAVNTAQTPWIIVLTHGPLYNTNVNKHSSLGGTDPNGNPRWGAQDPEEWGMLLAYETPFFYRYGVNFVFSGHIHAHERFTAMYNGTANVKGTTYMTLGLGGAGPDTGGFTPFTCATPAPTSGGQSTCTAGKRYTQNGANTATCAPRATVGVAVTNEDDCCTDVPGSATGKCWPAGTQGAFVASTNTNGILPSAATNWFPFLPTTTYLQGSMFRNDMYYGYGTLAIISKDVAQYSFYATSQILGGQANAVTSTYTGSISKPIADPSVCLNAPTATVAPTNCMIDFTLVCNPKSTTSPYTGSATCPSSVTRVSTSKGAAGVPSPVLVTPVTITQQIDGITLATAQQFTNQNGYKGALAQVLGTLPANIVITSMVTTTRRVRSLLTPGVAITTYTTDSTLTSANVGTKLSTSAMNAALAQQTQISPAWTTSIAPTIGSGLTTTGTATTPAATPVTNTVGTNTASNACFAGSEVVTLENGASKAIADVQIGDRILSADVQGKTSFSDVVYVPHSANTIEATFVLLTTETGRSVKMTTNHILPAGQCEGAMSVRRADAVSVGDCVMTVDGVEKVMDMVTMQGKGIYTVVTNKEYIVVNGIVATPFGGVNPTLANIYYNLHRMMYAFMPQALASSQSVMQQTMDKFASLVL